MLWYPYTQMKNLNKVYEIEKAEGVYLYTKGGKKLIDSISSWWAVIHGYNNKELNEALINQLNKFSHVMLGGLTHESVIKFSEKLMKISPEGLNHVFFSDSGSVGVEVALKMAIQYFSNKNQFEKSKFLALEKAYHGDTFKTMEVGDDPAYHGAFKNLFKDCIHIPYPKSNFDSLEEEVNKDIEILEENLKKYSDEISAFILEPLIQAAGGFNFYSPIYLEKARELCDKYNVLLIFDEVATGFGRTGKLFATDYTGISPDIIVLGKGLTAGYIGHAVTIANDKVFNAFYDDDSSKAFMHGPTFMANPLACAVGLKSIEIFERENYLDKIKNIEKILKEELFKIKSDKIKDIRVLGACGVIEVKNSKDIKGLTEFGIEKGIWIRPFVKYIYTMPPYIIKEDELRKIISVMKEWLER